MLKTNVSKLIFVFTVIASLAFLITILPQFGFDSTLRGAFYYSSDYITNSIVSTSPQEARTFILMEFLDLFFVVPLYTLCLFIIFDMVMYNFRISPFKSLVFLPALMDIPENMIFITNLAFFKSAPVLTHTVAIFSFFKWTLGLVLILILMIFLIAKLVGVTGTIKIISYDNLWSNKKNIKTYFTWIIGHVITTIISIVFIVVYMFDHNTHPTFSSKWGAIAFVFALLYDYIFNLLLKIPAHIFDQKYNHWLRTVFISMDTIFLMFALSLIH